MKHLRHTLISILLLSGISGTVLFSSCKNKCGGTTCQNGGTCSDNVCICPTGFSGNACQTGWSTAFLGTYNCINEGCNIATTGAKTWQSSITTDATNGGYTIDISNFDNSGVTVAATVDSSISGKSNMNISPGLGGVGINANGTYDSTNEVLTMTYTTSSAGVSYKCNMIMTKIQ